MEERESHGILHFSAILFISNSPIILYVYIVTIFSISLFNITNSDDWRWVITKKNYLKTITMKACAINMFVEWSTVQRVKFKLLLTL